jgi:hypothetical protein
MRSLVARSFPFLIALVACSCALSRPFAPVGKQFRHSVPFEIGRTEVVDGNAITIEEVRGTRPAIEVGGMYIVTGTYKFAADDGKLYFWQTANNWDNTGPILDTQFVRVKKGEGRFALLHDMPGPGWFHLELKADDGREVADVYFGHGETLRK